MSCRSSSFIQFRGCYSICICTKHQHFLISVIINVFIDVLCWNGMKLNILVRVWVVFKFFYFRQVRFCCCFCFVSFPLFFYFFDVINNNVMCVYCSRDRRSGVRSVVWSRIILFLFDRVLLFDYFTPPLVRFVLSVCLPSVIICDELRRRISFDGRCNINRCDALLYSSC